MKIISVQSFSGGTGVSLTASEYAIQYKNRGERVLAIDLCHQRSLHELLEGQGFIWLDDSRQLFRSPGVRLQSKADMPRCASLYDPNELSVYFGGLEKYFLTQDLDNADDHFVEYFPKNLEALKEHFDYCIVDIPNGHEYLMQLFYVMSDEIVLIARDHMLPTNSYEHYQNKIILSENRKDAPSIRVLEDRNSLHLDKYDEPLPGLRPVMAKLEIA